MVNHHLTSSPNSKQPPPVPLRPLKKPEQSKISKFIGPYGPGSEHIIHEVASEEENSLYSSVMSTPDQSKPVGSDKIFRILRKEP